MNDSEPRAAGSPVFVTTHWSVVLSARESSSLASLDAMESLCRAYWYPLYAYVRRSGHSPSDAQDLTQEFFSRLIQPDYLKSVAPEKGRFRTFLLVALKRFLANEWDRVRAQKRGGGQVHLSLDFSTGETRYQVEPSNAGSADRVYDRRWALMLLDQTMARLRDDFARSSRADDYEKLKVYLTADRGSIDYAGLAQQLGQSEGAVRVSVHRLRKRFREIFRQIVAETVTTTEDVEAEMRHLLGALAE